MWLAASWTLFLSVFSVEVLRIRAPSGPLNRAVLGAFRPFIRAHETTQFAGIAYYTAGVAVTTLVFPKTAATIGILCLALLDPVAALFGSLLQKALPSARMRNGKSAAGFCFSAVAAVVIVATLLLHAQYSTLEGWDVAAIAGLVGVAGALTEAAIPSPQLVFGPATFPVGLDDNAIIPFVSAAVCAIALAWDDHTVHLAPWLVAENSRFN